MSTAIYYFSATGNSLTTARKLAEKLGDCRLVNIATVRNNINIIEDAETRDTSHKAKRAINRLEDELRSSVLYHY